MRYRYIVTAAFAASVACGQPLVPTELRQDFGILVVQVRDVGGAPVPGAWVFVEAPGDTGGLTRHALPTGEAGDATFTAIRAGTRAVEVTPPDGFAADGPARREVEVVRRRTVTTRFTLRQL